MVSIAIVDDDRQDAQALKEVIARYFAENKAGEYSVSEYGDGEELLEHYSPALDLIFLDIDMNRINGMSAAKKLRAMGSRTAIVFVTRMAHYAIRGYDVEALDFIVKPVDYYSFALKFKKALRYVENNRDNGISLRQEDTVVWLNESEILYVEVLNHFLIYHTARGDYKIWGALKTAEEALPRENFVACNRCYLVNLRYVRKVEKNIAEVGEDKLVISRYKRKEFLEALAEFWGRRG